jgi:hypothetical protein
MRTQYIRTRPDGRPVKWDYLSPAQMQALANTPWGPPCIICGQPLPTEADFAKHFVLTDIRFLNLGNCPRD